MMSASAAAKGLVRRVLAEDGTVRDDLAAVLLDGMSHSQLKAFAGELKRELRRRTVAVWIAGDAGAARDGVGRRFPGRSVAVADDPSLGAGLLVRAGDDIVDASVSGAIQRIIAELGANAPGAQT